MKNLLLVVTALVAVFALCCATGAIGDVVWKIGEFDEKYSELALPGDFSAYPTKFASDVTFHVGRDDPAVSWPYIQPGPVDIWAGARVHPFAIIFDLPETPKGTYTLRVDLIGMQSTYPPELGIDVNGHKGSAALPKVDAGDAVLTDATKGKQSLVELALPASALVRGENKIVLTTDKGSWIIYDAVSLTNDPSDAAAAPAVESLEIKPTIRFVRQGSKLKQVMEVSAQLTPGASEVEASVKIGDKVTKEALRPDLFGRASRDIHVDEVTEPVDAVMSIDLGGKVTSATCKMRPERHWNVYVQASTHVDIGYTDYQPKIKAVHNALMSKAIELCKKYPEFKWNSETAWVIDNYLSMMPKADVDAYIKLARERRVGSQAVYGHMLTEGLSHEEMIRDMYFSKSVSRKYGVPCDYALSCDVPTFSGSLPTILAQSGIKYFSAGLNLYRAHSYNRLFDKSPFYWEGPDGSRVLTSWGYGYGVAGNLGLTASVDKAAGDLEGFLRNYDRPNYPSDAVLVFGAFGDNHPNAPLEGLARVSHEWNEKYAYPKIIFCLGPEFFQYLEATCKDKIKVMKGDGGCYWEDGEGSSALETGLNRCAKEDLSVAEKLHSLTSAMGGGEYPKAALDSAWKNAVLYDEHTWGAYCSFTDPTSALTLGQWGYKSEFAHEAKRISDDILARGLSNLGKLVTAKKPSVVVFNPHSWPMTGLAKATMADGKTVDLWVNSVPAMGLKTCPLTTIDRV